MAAKIMTTLSSTTSMIFTRFVVLATTRTPNFCAKGNQPSSVHANVPIAFIRRKRVQHQIYLYNGAVGNLTKTRHTIRTTTWKTQRPRNIAMTARNVCAIWRNQSEFALRHLFFSIYLIETGNRARPYYATQANRTLLCSQGDMFCVKKKPSTVLLTRSSRLSECWIK